MKRKAKIFIIITIILFTTAGIIYLFVMAKDLEKYTSSYVVVNKSFIIYSSEGGSLNDGTSIDYALSYIQNSLKRAGYNVKILNTKYEAGVNVRKDILSETKTCSKCIVLDINLSKSVINSNKVLIRLSRDSINYENNLEYASEMEKNIKNLQIKINILSERNKKYYQDFGYRNLKIDISKNNKKSDLETIISNIIKSII